MDFTSLYTSTNTIISPDGSTLLSSTPGFIILRDATSFQILQSWRTGNGNNTDKLAYTQLAFSHDSKYCLAADIPNGLVQVYGIDNEKAVANIGAGPEGLQGVRWLDGGGESVPRLVACWAKHGLRVTVWNLETGRQHCIQSPKRGASAGWAIHPVSQDYLALLERHKGKDYLGIYDLASMNLVRHTVLPTTDAQDLSWSPCGRYIAVWESCLEYALHIVTPDGRLLHSHTLPQGGISGLGIRSGAWHPSGRFLAIGGYDDTLRILNDVSWSIGVEMELPGSVWGSAASKKGKGKVPIHREPMNWLADPATSGSIVSFDSILLPVSQLSSSSSNTTAKSSNATTKSSVRSAMPNPKYLGISQLSFSPSGKFLFIHSPSTTNHLSSQICILRFVRSSPALPYTATRPRTCCIIRTNQSIKKMEWKPSRPGESEGGGECLAIVTGEKSVLMWNEKAQSGTSGEDEESSSEEEDGLDERQRVIRPGLVEGIAVPSKTEFGATDISWSKDGSCMLLHGDKSFCLAYPLPGST